MNTHLDNSTTATRDASVPALKSFFQSNQNYTLPVCPTP